MAIRKLISQIWPINEYGESYKKIAGQNCLIL